MGAFPSRTPADADEWTRAWSLGEGVHAVAFSGDGATAAMALLDGTAVLRQGDTEARVTVHPQGSPLSFVSTAKGFLSGGDDGRVVQVIWGEEPVTLATCPGRWIDHVAAHPSGPYAYATGKEVFVSTLARPLPHPSSIGGLAFHPKGKRLAVGHYNGVSLWWLNTREPTPDVLAWKGSHLNVLWHPDGTYLMTSMQENALHGWRMKDGGELRMAGYPGKVHSFGFSSSGRWLATSGNDQIIAWPFSGSGPQGKPPIGLGMPENKPCTHVACNPSEELVAAGYATGRVVLTLFEDQLPIELLPPDNVPVTALAWDAVGQRLLAGKENGEAYLFTARRILDVAR